MKHNHGVEFLFSRLFTTLRGVYLGVRTFLLVRQHTSLDGEARRGRKRRKTPRRGGLSFFSASGERVRDDVPSGFRICARENIHTALLRRASPSSLSTIAPFPNHLSCRPEMTNVTCHAGTKENFHLPPATGNRVAPAMLPRREKKRAEGLFLRREYTAKIYVAYSRLLTCARARAVSPRWRRPRLTITNDADLCFLLIVF